MKKRDNAGGKPKKSAHKGSKDRAHKYKKSHPVKKSGHGDNRISGKATRPAVIENLSLFGMHAVREAWLNPDRQIDALYITQAAYAEFEPHIAHAKKKGLNRPQPVIVDKQKLDISFPESTVHQGIALRAQLLEEFSVIDVINEGAQRVREGKRSLVFLLDQVTDPHNIGAIIRSASAFNVSGMVVQKKHTPPLKGVVGKTACGGLDHLLIAHETNLSRAIETLKNDGYFVIGLDERGEESLEDFVPPQKCAFVLGAEGPGLRRLTKEACDQMIKLPTSGAVGSLNVSNAAAICLYALTSYK